VIIPTYNHFEDALKPCIESIMLHTDLNRIDEIIVVANGCTDGTREYVESLGRPFTLLWYDDPLGYAVSVNNGIKHSKSDYVILLNNDTVLLSQEKHSWIDMLISPFADGAVGMTGPSRITGVGGFEFFIFFCVAIAKKVFDEIGLLDESFVVGSGEDTDFCYKAACRGYKFVMIPDESAQYRDGMFIGGFPIWHPGGRTVHEFENWNDIMKRNGSILVERYGNIDLIRSERTYDEAQYSSRFKILDFSFFDRLDLCDKKWKEWSRCYEYPYVLRLINGNGYKKIHNTACGGMLETHRMFIEELINIGFDVTNSDVSYYNVPNFVNYDVRERRPDLSGRFDAVLCISSLEHINENHVIIIDNLLDQVKDGGVLIITFDYPDVNLKQLEEYFSCGCMDVTDKLNGLNSLMPDNAYGHLNIVGLVIEK